MAELKEKRLGNLSLLREKSLVVDKTDGTVDGRLIETIRSNRCAFTCDDDLVVVRTKYMHLALRLSSIIYRDYHFKGPIDKRGEKTIDWALFWLEAQSSFDQEFDRLGWCQIYVNGESVYSTHHSSYIETIEKCSVSGEVQSYDETLGVTERLFAEKGQHIEITHSSTVSTTIKEESDHVRLGLIHRGGKRDTVFSVSVMNKPNKPHFYQIIDLAADFIEAINLTHEFDAVKKKLKLSAVHVSASETHYARSCRERRGKIERMITGFEDTHAMRYRPERPVLGSPGDYSILS